MTFRILAVCTGNICRSPMIEAMLRYGLDGADGTPWASVRSAGTQAVVGAPMQPYSRHSLETRGVPAGEFAARQVKPDMVAGADLVLTATLAHRGRVVELQPTAAAYTFTLAEFAALTTRAPVAAPRPTHAARARAAVAAARAQRGYVRVGAADDLADPIGRPQRTYEAVARLIERDVGAVVAGLAPSRTRA